MDGGEELHEVVEAQARARIAGDIAAFASYITPQALLRLHRQGEPLRGQGAKRFELLDIKAQGTAAAESEVRYHGAGSYVLRTRWERPDGLWRAVMVEMPPELSRSPLWRRVLGLKRRGRVPVTDRRDLR